MSIDRNGNMHVTRNDDAVKKFPHLRAPIKNVVGVPIPDRQTQIAQLITGGVHVIGKSTPDMLAELAKNPDLRLTPFPTRMLVYITLDAAGRSGAFRKQAAGHASPGCECAEFLQEHRPALSESD